MLKSNMVVTFRSQKIKQVGKMWNIVPAQNCNAFKIHFSNRLFVCFFHWGGGWGVGVEGRRKTFTF